MMATYNGEKYLREQLDSIINQSCTEWKLFISDDGSTDNTVKILIDYKNKYPDKIELINLNKRMGGAKENFIFLVNNCPKADYYMFSDQDDVWDKDKIETLLHCIKNDKSTEGKLVHCKVSVVDENLNLIRENFRNETENSFSKLLLNNYIPGCAILFDDILKNKMGNIPQTCYMHDWWIVLYAKLFGKIIYCDYVGNYYRQHENNVIGSEKRRIKSKDIIQKIFFPYDDSFSEACDRYAEKIKKCKIQAKAFGKKYNSIIPINQKRYLLCFINLGKNRFRDIVDYLRYYRIGAFRSDMYAMVSFIRPKH